MGWMSDKQAETAAMLEQVIAPSVPAGETLRGCVYGTKKSSFSVKLYALGVTDQHLLIQQVDRKWKPIEAAIVAAPSEIKLGNIFSEGAEWTLGEKDMEIRFEARGEKYKLSVLGGNMLENKLAGQDGVAGLEALATFLRSAPK